MKVIIRISLILLVLVTGKSGWCPKPELDSKFDLDRYQGTWYEILRSDNIAAEPGDCNFHQIVLNEGDGTFNFDAYQRVNGEFTKQTIPGLCETEKGYPGRCFIKPNPFGDWIEYYQIIATDYDNYLLAYSTAPYENSYIDIIVLGARSRNLNWTQFEDIIINQLGFSINQLKTGVQKDCPLYQSS